MNRKSLPHINKDFLNSNHTKFQFHFSHSFSTFLIPLLSISPSILLPNPDFLSLSFIFSGKRQHFFAWRKRFNHYYLFCFNPELVGFVLCYIIYSCSCSEFNSKVWFSFSCCSLWIYIVKFVIILHRGGQTFLVEL